MFTGRPMNRRPLICTAIVAKQAASTASREGSDEKFFVFLQMQKSPAKQITSRGFPKADEAAFISCVRLKLFSSSLHVFLADEEFADASSLAGTFAQVVELGTTHVAAALDFDGSNRRRVELERTSKSYER